VLSLQVTVLSTETVDDFWRMTPYSIAEPCYKAHLKCGQDEGQKSGWGTKDGACTLKWRQCIYQWRDCSETDTHYGTESCKKYAKGPYTVHNNRIFD
jgi:hypothetical protein